MKKILLLSILFFTSFAWAVGTCRGYSQSQTACTDTQSIITSGNQINVQNGVKDQSTASLSLTFYGAPATAIVTTSGCISSVTCTVIDTYTGTTNVTRVVSLSVLYNFFVIKATWTGGNNVSLTVITTLTSGNGGGGGGGATLPFPGPVCATSASGGTVCTSSQIQSAIGTGVYQAAGSYQAPISLTTTGTNCATSTFAANVLNIPACTPTSGGLTSFTTGNLSPLFTVGLGGSPTTSPALAFTLSNAAQNSVLAGPSTGGSGAPSYRALVSADIPSLAYLPSSTQLAQTLSSATHQWIKSYTASTGTFTQTQPASTDLSDYPIGGFAAATASTTVNGQTCTLGSSCTVTASSAPTYYVSTSGSDSNNGTSIATPWATIAHVSSLQSSFTPGTKILFQKGGVWSEEFDITSLSGSNGSPIMIGGYGNGSYWTIDGGQTSGVNGRNYCIDAINTTFKWITVNGLECRNAYMQGVTFQAYTGTGTNGVGIVVENSYIHHDGKSACTTCGTTPATDPGGYFNQLDAQVTTGVQFLNNTIDHCGGHNCLEVHYDAGNPIISGNIVGTLAPFCNHMCIDWKGGTNVLVQNNTVYCPTCTLAAFYTENTNAAYVEINLPNETATVTGNVAYGMNVANATGFQVETGGTAASGSPTINAKFYNNTYYSANSSTYGFMDGSCTGHTLDIQKNIFDGGQVDIHTGCTTTYDYNVDGGVYPITFGYISPGPHDLTNVNPLYVTVAVGNFTPSANSILTGGVADTVNTNAWLGALNNTSFNSNLAGASVTATAMQSALSGQGGCTTAGNVWSPQSNTCLSLTSGFTQIACVGTSADQTAIAAVDAAGVNIAIVSGSCLFSSNTALNATYWFFGGKFAPASSVTVTFNIEPQASPTQIFTGSGNVVLAGSATTAYPEWFGATGNSSSYTDSVPFNAAVVALSNGTIVLTKSNYYTSAAFVVNKSNVNVQSPNGMFGTAITSNSATADIFDVVGTGANCTSGAILGNVVSGFAITRSVTATGTAIGLNLTDSCWPNIHEFASYNSISNIYLNGTADAHIYNGQANFTVNGTGNRYGVNIDSTTAGNYSSHIGPDFAVAAAGVSGGTTYGFYEHGIQINDLWTENISTEMVNYGIYIDATSASGNTTTGGTTEDIHFVAPVMDNCLTSCLYVKNLQPGTTSNSYPSNISVDGGWFMTTTSGAKVIDIESSQGVQMSNAEIAGADGVTGTQPSCLYLNSSSGNRFDNLSLQHCYNPITLVSSNNNYIASHVFNDNSFLGTAPSIVSLTTSSRNQFNLNGVLTYATTGITAGSGSNYNVLIGGTNGLDPTHIGTMLSDSGTGNVWTVPVNVSDIQVTVGTTAVPANSCLPSLTTYNTATMAGLTSTMGVTLTPSASLIGVTGWVPTAAQLYFNAVPGSGSLSWQVCNPSSSSITPSSSTTWNVSAR